jgi:hypothetical protein
MKTFVVICFYLLGSAVSAEDESNRTCVELHSFWLGAESLKIVGNWLERNLEKWHERLQ